MVGFGLVDGDVVLESRSNLILDLAEIQLLQRVYCHWSTGNQGHQ